VERLAGVRGEAVLELEERRPVLLMGRRSSGHVGDEKVEKKQDGGGGGVSGATEASGHLRLAADEDLKAVVEPGSVRQCRVMT
jgi:hypothetical protein